MGGGEREDITVLNVAERTIAYTPCEQGESVHAFLCRKFPHHKSHFRSTAQFTWSDIYDVNTAIYKSYEPMARILWNDKPYPEEFSFDVQTSICILLKAEAIRHKNNDRKIEDFWVTIRLKANDIFAIIFTIALVQVALLHFAITNGH